MSGGEEQLLTNKSAWYIEELQRKRQIPTMRRDESELREGNGDYSCISLNILHGFL